MPYKDLQDLTRHTLAYMNRRREERKLAAIIQLGGKCMDCPFDDLSRWEVFQFDHLPGTEKLGNLGRMFAKTTDLLIQAELKKCELVCANCHTTRTRRRARKKPELVGAR